MSSVLDVDGNENCCVWPMPDREFAAARCRHNSRRSCRAAVHAVVHRDAHQRWGRRSVRAQLDGDQRAAMFRVGRMVRIAPTGRLRNCRTARGDKHIHAPVLGTQRVDHPQRSGQRCRYACANSYVERCTIQRRVGRRFHVELVERERNVVYREWLVVRQQTHIGNADNGAARSERDLLAELRRRRRHRKSIHDGSRRRACAHRHTRRIADEHSFRRFIYSHVVERLSLDVYGVRRLDRQQADLRNRCSGSAHARHDV